MAVDNIDRSFFRLINMNNNEILKKILFEEHITEYGIVDTDSLIYQKEYLLKNKDNFKNCIVLCIPYRTQNNNPDNFSKYAATQDYHLYTTELFKRLYVSFSKVFPKDTFVGFADHSPINERDAAFKANLGFIGKNSMLINKRYGSYIFIASIFTTLSLEISSFSEEHCCNCGKCLEACPSGALKSNFENCLSYITQKKNKTNIEINIMKNNKSVWGCDICQDVCPHNSNTEYSPIPFFNNNIINHLTSDLINNMTEEEFIKRAFAWRGRKIILENLSYFNE